MKIYAAENTTQILPIHCAFLLGPLRVFACCRFFLIGYIEIIW